MKDLNFSLVRESMFPGCDGILCKVNPKIGFDGKNTAFLHYSMLKISASDVFKGTYIAKSVDGGNTFSEPQKLPEIERMVDGIRESFFANTIHYDKQFDKWFAIGYLMYYENEWSHMRHKGIGITKPVIVMLDPEKCAWCSEPIPIPMPYECICAMPHAQPILFPNSEMLLGFYVCTEEMDSCSVLTVKYRFDGEKLNLLKAGTVLGAKGFARGFCEPSLARLGDKYYLTIRTDEMGLFATSDDGFTFSKAKPWRWDDGSLIGNSNTMQRFIRHKDGLYLAYTRVTPHNNHIFRNRAPMFMARFDEDRECLIKSSEVILVPELGARLGNFNVTDAFDNESWLVTAEWMQTVAPDHHDWKNCMKYGADNRIWRTKIIFE